MVGSRFWIYVVWVGVRFSFEYFVILSKKFYFLVSGFLVVKWV